MTVSTRPVTDRSPGRVADAPARRRPDPLASRVVRTERLSASLVRVVLGGVDLARFAGPSFADAYVKVLFLHPDGDYERPLSVERIRETMPEPFWPRLRTYTVRHWDETSHELTLDFVVHGDSGLAGPWAAAAQPGDEVFLLGPGGGYSPDPAAAFHLLVGDESALPAIAAAAELLPPDAAGALIVEVHGPADEIALSVPADVRVTWVHRGTRPLGEALVDTVMSLTLPDSRVQAFVHGEAGFVKRLRRWLRVERGLPAADLSISGYWRAGHDDEGWRAVKREFNQAMEAEEKQAQERASLG